MRHHSLAFAFALSLAIVACGPRNQDKLDDSELGEATNGKRPAAVDTRCTGRATSDEIKRQLFARAAEIRGSNADNYAKIAGFALIDVSGAAPVAAVSANELVDCRGHATLRLPAGLKVAGGRTTLGGDVDYSVAPGTRGMVTLGRSDAIAIPLATLTQNRSAAPAPAPAPVPSDAPATPAPVVPVPTITRPAPPPPPPVAETSARPSFDCRRARTAGERAVCADPALAALDRDMAAQYRTALANGGPRERSLLVETRDRFLGYRDRCPSNACIDRAYRGRMREIDDIVAGRWRGR
jgi:uncharacterized protein